MSLTISPSLKVARGGRMNDSIDAGESTGVGKSQITQMLAIQCAIVEVGLFAKSHGQLLFNLRVIDH